MPHFAKTIAVIGIAAILLLVAAINSVSAQSSPTTAPIKLGYLDPKLTHKTGVLLLTKGVAMGIEAGFARTNRNGGVHGRPLQLVTVNTDFTEETYAPRTQELLAQHPDTVALLATLGNEHINRMKPILEQEGLPSLGPMASDPSARGFHKETVYIRPDPWAEIVAVVEQVVSRFRIKRIGFMWTTGFEVDGVPYGVTHRQAFYKFMKELGLEVVAEFTYDYNYKKKVNETTFDPLTATSEFLSKRPDAVVMFPTSDETAIEFILYCLAHPLATTFAPNLKFFVTETLAVLAQMAFAEAKKRYPNQLKDLTPEGRVFSTFTFPLTTDTSYDIVREYHEDMSAMYGSAYLQTVGYTTIAGYITARFAAEVLKRSPQPVTRRGIIDTIYAPSMWAVSDVTYGIFKASCPHQAASKKSVSPCRCNEGAHLIDIGTLDATYQWRIVDNASFSWEYTQCSGVDIKLSLPTNYLQLFDSNDPAEVSLAALLRLGKEGAEATSTLEPKAGDIAQRSLRSNPTATVKDLNTSLLVTTISHSLMGEQAVAEEDLPWPLIDPFQPKAALAQPFREKVLHIHATLQQEFHIFAAHAANLGISEIVLVVADATDRTQFMVPFEQSATTFRLGSQSFVSVSEAPSSGYLVVAGVPPATVIDALKANPQLRIGVAAAEFHAQYTTFVNEAGSDTSWRSRLLTATNLPHWGAAGATTSALIEAYHSSIGGAANAHPVSLRSFVATRAVVAVLDYLSEKITPETVLRTWYDVSIIFADNSVVLGPYFKEACNKDDKKKESCECNLGARKLRIFSLYGLLNGTEPTPEKELALEGCRIPYTQPKTNGDQMSVGTIAGVSVAALAIMAIAGVAALKTTQSGQRDTRHAPKDPSQPYTLVFTDIQSSTSLWARVPDEMGPALDTHHEIIRKLIKKHRGYEVKTIGDAFMIAFESADDAVNLCEDLQTAFFEHDWGTTAIDDTYKQLEQEALEEDPATDKAISCNLPEALYRKMWNGLRVRCGVHTGVGEIKLDEVTHGYDYYGGVSNIAARTEAVGNGGQICVTSFAMSAQTKERTTKDLGAVDLRGVTDPVEIHEVDGVAGRKFAGLRIEKGLEEAEYSSTSNTGEGMSESVLSGGNVSGGAIGGVAGDLASQASGVSNSFNSSSNCNLQEALTTMFAVMEVGTRRSTLKKIGLKWRVQVGPKPVDKAAECVELVTAISKRLLGVLHSKKKAASTSKQGIPNTSFPSVGRRGSQVMPESTRLVLQKATLSPAVQDLPGVVDGSNSEDKYKLN